MVITGAANTAARARGAVEVRMDEAFVMDSWWQHPTVRI
ncbi:hypothetical protein SynRS9902_02780 [Synechococcus sp. RS9902]|nr:hypothetical protein SynRS9902_02780 [Synechococcus sp. RS9902]